MATMRSVRRSKSLFCKYKKLAKLPGIGMNRSRKLKGLYDSLASAAFSFGSYPTDESFVDLCDKYRAFYAEGCFLLEDKFKREEEAKAKRKGKVK